jgi:putative aldouronate transport system permease protein
MMFAPVAVYFLIFKYAPMFGLVIAFKDYNFHDGIWGSPWVGWHNFELVFSSPSSLSIIRNTFVLSVLSLVFGFPMPIVLAILLNEVRNIAFKRVIQTIVYLPHFFSWVIVGGIVITVFSMESGIVNRVVEHVAGSVYPFLYRPVSWVAIFVGSGIWKEMGFSAIIYLAALTTIDPSLYEAAKMDGAGKWRQIVHVTIPGIRSTIILLLILSMGRIMEVGFDQVFVLQNDVVGNVADVISTYIFRVGLQGTQFSLTAAIGFFESIVGLLFVLLANRVAKRFGQGFW